MAEQSDWVLPGPEGVMVDQGELLLLDWCLCAPSRILPGLNDLDDVMKWKDMRYDIWDALRRMAVKNLKETNLPIQKHEAATLMGIVPTTFRWGTGPDCGYTLKTKLARYAYGFTDKDAPPAEKEEKPNVRQRYDDN